MRTIYLSILIMVIQVTACVACWSSSERAKYEIDLLSAACTFFKEEYGIYPPEDTWLDELTGRKHPKVNTKRVVFYEMLDSSANDSWGNPFIYKLPGIHNPDSFDIYSNGKDGQSKTGGNDRDDINSWDKSLSWTEAYKFRLITPGRILILLSLAAVVVVPCFVLKRKNRIIK